MCIIIAKPAGIDIPSTEVFNNCATSNRDGIGISFALPNGSVHITKGFENVKKLESTLKARGITKEHNLIIHFRFATHGLKDRGNCHPFPVTKDFEEMRFLNCACETAVAHNGVFGGLPASDKHSDTMKFLHGILGDPAVINNLNQPVIKSLLKAYCGLNNKLAFLRSSGISLIGEFELDNGVYYSNRQYIGWGKRDSGNEYCHIHRRHDSCAIEADREGKSWCYNHKEYDHCTWCKEHKEYDLCEQKLNGGLFDEKGNKLLKFFPLRCEWCAVTEGILYRPVAEANLCEECMKMFHTYGDCSACN